MKKLKGKIETLEEVEILHYHDNYRIRIQKVRLPPVEGQKERKETVEEIRIAYWDGKKYGQFAPIMPENELARLIAEGIRKGILSKDFIKEVQKYTPK